MRRWPVIPVLLLLAGCGDRIGSPAPVALHGAPGSAAAEPSGPHPDRVVVGNGDTLYGLSRRWGVPMRAIIDANGLNPPYRLAAGASLALPQVRTHTVQPGETLTSVARQQGVDASTLAATNHLAAPYVIRSGEVLVLPAQVQAASVPPPPPAERHPPPPAVLGSAPIVAALAPIGAAGEPLARTRVLAVSPLASPQPPGVLPPPSAAVAVAALPPPAVPTPPVVTPPAVPAAPERLAALPPPEDAPPPEPLRPAPPEPPAAAESAPVPPPPPVAVARPQPPPPDRLAALPPAGVSAKGFQWPVRGRVISTFGTDSEGIHNDGINIAAPAGTPILAADAGEVAYAGNELKGYGNLILLKHANGFVSAYAHAEALLVKRGDKVARGQPIAQVGATGAVTQPQLHFELRRGAKALDPADYLPEAAATASR